MKFRIIGTLLALAALGGILVSGSSGNQATSSEQGQSNEVAVDDRLVGEERLLQWMEQNDFGDFSPEGKPYEGPSPIITPSHDGMPSEVIFCPDGEPLLQDMDDVNRVLSEDLARKPDGDVSYLPACADGSTPDLYLEMVARGD